MVFNIFKQKNFEQLKKLKTTNKEQANPLQVFNNSVLETNPIFWAKHNEGSGTIIEDSSGNNFDGIYANVSWDGTLNPFNELAVLYNGTTSIGEITNASFLSASNLDEGCMITFVKMLNSGVWTDGSTDRFLYFERNTSNRISVFKNTGTRALSGFRVAGGASDNTNYTIPTATTEWFSIGCSWSVLNDEFKFYVNGTQQDITQTGLIASGTTAVRLLIGANSGASNVLNGYISNSIFWNTPINSNIQDLMLLGLG